MKNKWCSRRWNQPRRNEIFAGLLLGVLFSASQAVAGVPDWLRVAARAPLPSYPNDTNAVVLLNEQVTTVKDNGDPAGSHANPGDCARDGHVRAMTRCGRIVRLAGGRVESPGGRFVA